MSMADRVVIDASVALAFLTPEVGTPEARHAVAVWQASATELLVPSHFWLEVTNVLGRRPGLGPGDIVAMFVDLDYLELRTIELDRPLLLLAIDQMARSRLTAYDAMYLAVARATKARLATLDRRLAEAAGEAGFLVGSGGSGRISETSSTYRADSEAYAGWAHTAIVGAHIAELRLQALAET
jgi:predicted nucleic acid-binding protein